MSKYWAYSKSKKKLSKRQIILAHKQGRRLEKYKDHVKQPYALATSQVKKGYKIKS